jgi:hypothetical protein
MKSPSLFFVKAFGWRFTNIVTGQPNATRHHPYSGKYCLRLPAYDKSYSYGFDLLFLPLGLNSQFRQAISKSCKKKNPVDGLSVKDFIQLLNDTFSRNDFDAFSILVIDWNDFV